MSVYLDYNSSAPIDPRVVDEMVDVYRNVIGNADSRTHDFGNHAREIVETARSKVAQILGVNNDEVFFTSGATESNNIAIRGLTEYGLTSGKKHIITTTIEHKAVLKSVEALEKEGFEVEYVKPEKNGRISAEDLLSRVRQDTLLVSVMHVNNETGIIQPVLEIGKHLKECGVLFHIDATQSFGKLVNELRDVDYDMLAMSAHKIYGPQGVGALVLRRKKYKLPPVKPIMHGGQQEHGIRPGTIPVALVAGLGKACEIAAEEWQEDLKKNQTIKNELMLMLDESGLTYSFNGCQEYCVASTMNISIKGVQSEALMLSSKEFCGISNGSACNSNSYSPSHVLVSMGVPEAVIDNSIRISWGRGSDLSQIRNSFANLLESAKNLSW